MTSSCSVKWRYDLFYRNRQNTSSKVQFKAYYFIYFIVQQRVNAGLNKFVELQKLSSVKQSYYGTQQLY